MSKLSECKRKNKIVFFLMSQELKKEAINCLIRIYSEIHLHNNGFIASPTESLIIKFEEQKKYT